jgi:hypothetical protein
MIAGTEPLHRAIAALEMMKPSESLDPWIILNTLHAISVTLLVLIDVVDSMRSPVQATSAGEKEVAE